MEIIATFFVGLPGGNWEVAGPYSGRGENLHDAGHDAIRKCANEYVNREVMFMTFASIESVDRTPAGAVTEGRFG